MQCKIAQWEMKQIYNSMPFDDYIATGKYTCILKLLAFGYDSSYTNHMLIIIIDHRV